MKFDETYPSRQKNVLLFFCAANCVFPCAVFGLCCYSNERDNDSGPEQHVPVICLSLSKWGIKSLFYTKLVGRYSQAQTDEIKKRERGETKREAPFNMSLFGRP